MVIGEKKKKKKERKKRGRKKKRKRQANDSLEACNEIADKNDL